MVTPMLSFEQSSKQGHSSHCRALHRKLPCTSLPILLTRDGRCDCCAEEVTCCWQGHGAVGAAGRAVHFLCEEVVGTGRLLRLPWVTLSPWGGIALPVTLCPLPSASWGCIHHLPALDGKPVASGSLGNPDVTDLKGEGERKLRGIDK